MKNMRSLIFGAIIAFTASLLNIRCCLEEQTLLNIPDTIWVTAGIFGGIFLMCTVIRPKRSQCQTRALKTLDMGCALLRIFIVSATLALLIHIVLTILMLDVFLPRNEFGSAVSPGTWVPGILACLLVEAFVFWAGMIRLYTTSVQLGIKHRLLAVIAAWIPGLNICYLLKLIRLGETEVEIETEKLSIDAARAKSQICKTKYPILLVHGVFFRDFRYLNYWGRIPSELMRNGAAVYYGQQQSAASVEACGRELADRIRAIVHETGCEKVNIIAHSKGGLDSRAAISHFGAAQYVASLTTINTPHEGCIFAEYLLSKVPEKAKQALAHAYNTTLKKLGDENPDFLRAAGDLTASACSSFNRNTPDVPGVVYESVMSYCKMARSGRFPLNVSYPMVKHFDGKNDGLVSMDSAKWGSRFTVVEPKGRRGISHGDMIDLNRENIPGFDVREFYVSVAAGLRERGF